MKKIIFLLTLIMLSGALLFACNKGNDKILDKIEISKRPDKDIYATEESLELKGGKIELFFTDKTSRIVSIEDSMVSGFDKSKTGEQKITVRYKDKETSFSVTVADKIIDNQEKFDKMIFDEAEENKILYLKKHDYKITEKIREITKSVSLLAEDGTKIIIDYDFKKGYVNNHLLKIATNNVTFKNIEFELKRTIVDSHENNQAKFIVIDGDKVAFENCKFERKDADFDTTYPIIVGSDNSAESAKNVGEVTFKNCEFKKAGLIITNSNSINTKIALIANTFDGSKAENVYVALNMQKITLEIKENQFKNHNLDNNNYKNITLYGLNNWTSPTKDAYVSINGKTTHTEWLTELQQSNNNATVKFIE